MAQVLGDHLLLLRLSGLHCQRCEEAVRRALIASPAVHEVEIDFPSALASVLFDPTLAEVAELTAAVQSAGYTVTGTEVVRP